MAFKVSVHQLPLIAPGKTRVTAVLTIKNESTEAAGGAGSAQRYATVVGDNSGSMENLMPDLRRAMMAWVDVLEDGVKFTVFTFSTGVKQVYPARIEGKPRYAIASNETRAAAKAAISTLVHDADTYMHVPIAEVRSIAKTLPGHISHCLFLTDGANRGGDDKLVAEVNTSKGIFQCDARILGANANVAYMRDKIATPLLGQVKVITDSRNLAADFAATLQEAMGKSAGDVQLKLRCPAKTVGIEKVTETVPKKLDLEAVLDTSDPEGRTWLYRTAPWAAGEERDYLVVVKVQALPGLPPEKAAQLLANLTAEGRELPEAAIPSVCWSANGKVEAARGDNIRIAFTDDAEKSRVYVAHNEASVRRVAHATGQVELVDARQQLAEAARKGDVDEVTRRAKILVATVEKTGDDELIKEEVTRVAKLGVTVSDDKDADGTRRVAVRKVDKLTADDFDSGTTQTKKFVRKS